VQALRVSIQASGNPFKLLAFPLQVPGPPFKALRIPVQAASPFGSSLERRPIVAHLDRADAVFSAKGAHLALYEPLSGPKGIHLSPGDTYSNP
jgi:hypothetical protein